MAHADIEDSGVRAETQRWRPFDVEAVCWRVWKEHRGQTVGAQRIDRLSWRGIRQGESAQHGLDPRQTCGKLHRCLFRSLAGVPRRELIDLSIEPYGTRRGEEQTDQQKRQRNGAVIKESGVFGRAAHR